MNALGLWRFPRVGQSLVRCLPRGVQGKWAALGDDFDALAWSCSGYTLMRQSMEGGFYTFLREGRPRIPRSIPRAALTWKSGQVSTCTLFLALMCQSTVPLAEFHHILHEDGLRVG